MAMLTSLYVVSTFAQGERSGHWMNVNNARQYAREFVANPIAKQLVVQGPVETHVWHKGEGWVTISTAEFRAKVTAIIRTA